VSEELGFGLSVKALRAAGIFPVLPPSRRFAISLGVPKRMLRKSKSGSIPIRGGIARNCPLFEPAVQM
jgi:hypothetical protein